MSKYSGKADFADSIEMRGGIEYLKNSKVYIYEEQPDGTYKDKLLHFEKESDIVPYYAHIIGMAYHNNKENKHIIHLSSKSYPDSHEEEMLGYHLKTLIRYYNYCKRKKIEFTIDDALKKFSEWTLRYDGDTIKELAERVKEKGKKASIEGLKLYFSERYREELREELDRVLNKEERENEQSEHTSVRSVQWGMKSEVSYIDENVNNEEPVFRKTNIGPSIITLQINIKENQVDNFVKKNNLIHIEDNTYEVN